MKRNVVLLLCLFISLACLCQNKCIYPENLIVDFSIINQKIDKAEAAKFKVTFQNNGEKPILVADTLIDGDLYGFDSNFWIEIEMQDSDSIFRNFGRKYYRTILPPEGKSFQSQLKETLLNPGQHRVLYFDFFPVYLKYLRVGRYVARIGLRKIPIYRKGDCGAYYFSDPIYFDVLKELKQEGLE
jgi:hypothetical protein